MSHDTYVVSYQCAGKVYIVAKGAEPAYLSSRTVAASAIRRVIEAAAGGNPIAMIVATTADFRIHRASTVPGRTDATVPVLPGLSAVIVRGRYAKAWHARGARPFPGSKVPGRRFARKTSSRYNTEDRPVYGS